MKRWDAEHDGEIYRDIQAQANPTLSLYALESYAIIVDNLVQEELFRNLVLSHAEIARSLEETNQLLALSERRLREAQQIAHIGRWDIDHVHDTRSWSASYLEILRMDPATKPSRELFETFIVPEDLPLVHQAYVRLMTQQQPWDSQVRLRLRNGEIIWVHVRLQTEFDEAGRPLRSYGTMQDITQIKRAEEELERYNKHLKEMVADKVKEISESQMATILRWSSSRNRGTTRQARISSARRAIAACSRKKPARCRSIAT